MILAEANKKPTMNFMMTGRLRTPHWGCIIRSWLQAGLGQAQCVIINIVPEPRASPIPMYMGVRTPGRSITVMAE